MTMATSMQRQDQGTDTAALVRRRLVAGDTPGAVACAWHAVQAKAAARRRSDLAPAMLLDAMLAAALVHIAESLPTQQPRKPRGYTSGPPSAEHLLAAYEMARNETARR